MYIYNLKRQINECFLFANETIWLIDFATGNVLYLGSVVAIYFEVVDFLATLAADVGELLLTLDAEVATACEIGGDARSAATSEWVKMGFCVGCLPHDFSHGAMAGSRHTSVICLSSFKCFISL